MSASNNKEKSVRPALVPAKSPNTTGFPITVSFPRPMKKDELIDEAKFLGNINLELKKGSFLRLELAGSDLSNAKTLENLIGFFSKHKVLSANFVNTSLHFGVNCCRAVASHQHLYRLDLSGNLLRPTEFTRLMGALKSSPSLLSLKLRGSFNYSEFSREKDNNGKELSKEFGLGLDALNDLLKPHDIGGKKIPSTIQVLDFSFNHMRLAEGQTFLPDIKDYSLTELVINRNNLHPAALAHVITHFQGLELYAQHSMQDHDDAKQVVADAVVEKVENPESALTHLYLNGFGHNEQSHNRILTALARNDTLQDVFLRAPDPEESRDPKPDTELYAPSLLSLFQTNKKLRKFSGFGMSFINSDPVCESLVSALEQNPSIKFFGSTMDEKFERRISAKREANKRTAEITDRNWTRVAIVIAFVRGNKDNPLKNCILPLVSMICAIDQEPVPRSPTIKVGAPK